MSEAGETPQPTAPSRLDGVSLAAFIALVVIGGSNAVAVRFSNAELPPFWGAAARFTAAAIIFWAIALVRHVAIPRGKALLGAVLYGVFAIGASYGLLYWGLVEIQASVAIVILSLGPLLTMLLAVAHGIERFRWRGLAGALIALVGIIVGMGAEFGQSTPWPSLIAIVAGVVCIAEGSVIYKFFPGGHPLSTNVVACTTGAAMLLIVSLVAGESWFLPSGPSTVAAYGYLVVIGSVGLFYVYLVLLSRWTASATSYAFLLFPLATIPIAALIADEQVTWGFVLGAGIALIGVWIGAFHRTREEQVVEEELEEIASEDPACETPYPGCA